MTGWVSKALLHQSKFFWRNHLQLLTILTMYLHPGHSRYILFLSLAGSDSRKQGICTRGQEVRKAKRPQSSCESREQKNGAEVSSRPSQAPFNSFIPHDLCNQNSTAQFSVYSTLKSLAWAHACAWQFLGALGRAALLSATHWVQEVAEKQNCCFTETLLLQNDTSSPPHLTAILRQY